MFIPTKTLEQLQEEALQRLQNTPLRDSGPGSVVRLLLAVVNSVLAEYYQRLDVIHMNSYVSTASGDFLDLLGEIVHCERRENEPDDEYRYRISQQALADATANRTAIRLAALSVDGVKDVILHEYALGTGSCAVYVVIDDLSQQDTILSSVKTNIDDVRASGVRVEVLTPKLVPIGLKMALLFKSGTLELDRQSLASLAEQTVAAYLNSFYPGQSVSIDDLVKCAISAGAYDSSLDSDIAEAHILSLTRNGKEVNVEDQYCRWNERFVEDGAIGVKVVQTA